MVKRSVAFCINLALMCSAGILVLNPPVVGVFIPFTDWTVPAYILGVDLFLLAIAACCVLYAKRPQPRARYFYFALAGVLLLPVVMIATELGLTYMDLSARGGTQLQNVHKPDPVLGWVPVPNTAGRHYSAGNYDVNYRIDSKGRRATLVDASAARRVLFFGDSFIFGQGVENEETALHLLARRKSGEFNVLNYGVMGYSLEQIYLRFRSFADEIRAHDVVVFALMSEDLSRNLISKGHVCSFAVGKRGIEFFPMLRGTQWESLRLRDECGVFETLGLNAHKYLFGRILVRYRRLTLQDRIIDNADAIFTQALELAKSRRASLVVLFLASPKECLRRAHQIDVSLLNSPYVSLLPHCPDDSESLARLQFPTDYHWSPFGNRLAAQAIEKVLDDVLSIERRVK